jgi:hypothetical protein
MPRFILRYRGSGPRPDAALHQIRQLDEADVIADSDRMLLVDAPEKPLRDLMATQKDWIVTTEQFIPAPDTRKRVEQPPSA